MLLVCIQKQSQSLSLITFHSEHIYFLFAACWWCNWTTAIHVLMVLSWEFQVINPVTIKEKHWIVQLLPSRMLNGSLRTIISKSKINFLPLTTRFLNHSAQPKPQYFLNTESPRTVCHYGWSTYFDLCTIIVYWERLKICSNSSIICLVMRTWKERAIISKIMLELTRDQSNKSLSAYF